MPEKISSATLVRHVGKRVNVHSVEPNLHGMLRVHSVGTKLVFTVLGHHLRRDDDINIIVPRRVGARDGPRRLEHQVRWFKFTGAGPKDKSE